MRDQTVEFEFLDGEKFNSYQATGSTGGPKLVVEGIVNSISAAFNLDNIMTSASGKKFNLVVGVSSLATGLAPILLTWTLYET
jgi:hypothetical protein